MTARGWLVRWLRPDPDRRVAAMAVTVADAKARAERAHAAREETSRVARTAIQARNDARAQAAAAEAAAEVYGRQLQAAEARLRRIADVLADQSLSAVDCPVCDRARQILMEDGPVSGGGQR